MIPDDFKFIKPGQIRTRIAPSPTGFLHLGTARAALFNYLFAKKNEGSFILRIEDTDLERSDPKYEQDIIESLKWLGINWTEGPDIGGKYAPYRQSERVESYAKYLEKLLKENKAYYCFCSEQDLKTKRQYALSQGKPWIYDGTCAQLPKEKVKKYLGEGRSHIIRFRTPKKIIEFNDLIRGKIKFDTGLIGDFSIAKNLTTPLYNFAVVVDDFEMEISHVIRGEDHISNTPKQILLQEALNFPRPKYAHLPLILGSDKSKLSKRHGAVAVSEYRKMGYLPEAIVNLMALLGWNPDTEREIYTIPSLLKEFSLEKVQKSGAVFSIKKLDYLNGFYIRQKTPEKLAELCLPYLIEADLIVPEFKSEQYPPAYGAREIVSAYTIKESGEKIDFEFIKKVALINQERLKKLSEIVELADFFFKKELRYPKELLKWKDMGEKELVLALDKLKNIFSKLKDEDFEKEKLQEILLKEAEEFSRQIKGLKAGDRGFLLWPLRVALTGKERSATPFEIIEVLGREKVIERIEKAKRLLNKP